MNSFMKREDSNMIVLRLLKNKSPQFYIEPAIERENSQLQALLLDYEKEKLLSNSISKFT